MVLLSWEKGTVRWNVEWQRSGRLPVNRFAVVSVVSVSVSCWREIRVCVCDQCLLLAREF